MKNKVEISVIIPAHNVEKHIEKTIFSLSKQTFKNFEVLIINDGSTDKTEEIANNALIKYKLNGKVITKSNGGQSSARNKGIKSASGNWIVMPDADDYLQEKYLENLHEGVTETNSVVGFCDIYKVTDDNITANIQQEKNLEAKNGKDFFVDFIKHSIKIGPYCLIIQKKFQESKNLYYDEAVSYSEEFVFITKLLYLAEKAVHVKNNLYNYCLRPNSVSTSANAQKIINTFHRLQEYQREYNKNNKYDAAFREIALKRWILATAHFCTKTMNYTEYKYLMNALGAKQETKQLLRKTINNETKVISLFFISNMKLFYLIMRKI